jgi:hypothetical protein
MTSPSGSYKYSVVGKYSAKKHGFDLDSKIRAAAGKRELGAGTDLTTYKRDIDFLFSKKDAAERARDRIKKIPGVTASMRRYPKEMME